MVPQLKEHPIIYDLAFGLFGSFYKKNIIAVDAVETKVKRT